MPVRFLCPFGHKLVVPDHRAGKKGRCPTCHQKVIVPVANPLPSGKPKKDWDADNEEITADGAGGALGFDAPAAQPAQGAPAAQPVAQPAAAAQPAPAAQVPQAVPTAQPFVSVPTAAPAQAGQQVPFQEIPQAPPAQNAYGQQPQQQQQQQQPWWPQQ